MKRLSNLYEQIISLDNLHLADEKARKGKLRSYVSNDTIGIGKQTYWLFTNL